MSCVSGIWDGAENKQTKKIKNVPSISLGEGTKSSENKPVNAGDNIGL